MIFRQTREKLAGGPVTRVRLREVRAWRERLGKAVAGGPVRVARDPGEG